MFDFLKPKKIEFIIFDCKEDITSFELAQIFQASTSMNALKNMKKLPEPCKRHFKIEE